MKHLIYLLTVLVLVAIVPIPMQGCAEKSESAPVVPDVKNIILMVGDGMGLAQISALMIAEDYAPLNMERATVGGFVKTYSANNRVTDSAAAATTYATGEKTNNSSLSITPDGTPQETILEKAEKMGFSTGLVATTEIQDATPGAFYGHNVDRGEFLDISLGLLTSGVDVVIGGGQRSLVDRPDGRNLVEELENQGYMMVDSLAELDSVTSGDAMALYKGDIPLVVDGRDPEYLPNATAKALEILTANATQGIFLMVEGSAIDSGGHDNDAEMMLGEMRDFDTAVGVAFDYADAHPETLVIVLADHETGGLTIPSGKENFLLPDSGVEFEWSTGGHTGTMVPLFAYGAHADMFGGVLNNVEVNHRMELLLGL
jgi:alkaline phosphatase